MFVVVKVLINSFNGRKKPLKKYVIKACAVTNTFRSTLKFGANYKYYEYNLQNMYAYF